MAASDYTDIFARFSDPLAAEVLAKFIASIGISCDLIDASNPISPFDARYAVRVARSLIDDLKEALKLTPVARFPDSISAQIVAGRLARDNIPSYVGGELVGPGMWKLGYSGVPIDDTGKLGAGTLAVPASFVDAAKRTLLDKISEAELTELALTYHLDPQDPP
jgi:hypothetical protein